MFLDDERIHRGGIPCRKLSLWLLAIVKSATWIMVAASMALLLSVLSSPPPNDSCVC